jgi:hypothetical protein
LHGYKARVTTGSEGTGPVRYYVEVTTANVQDAAMLGRAPPPEPGDVHGGSAFAGGRSEQAVVVRSGVPCTVHTGTCVNPRRSRACWRATPPFAAWGRCPAPGCGPAGCVGCVGSAKAGLQVRFAAIACDLRRTISLLHGSAA